MMPIGAISARVDATWFADTCGTCAHRDSEGVCRERRSAWHGWNVDATHHGCYFYNRLPYLGIGLADEPGERREQ